MYAKNARENVFKTVRGFSLQPFFVGLEVARHKIWKFQAEKLQEKILLKITLS